MSDCHGWKKRYKTSSEFHSVHERRLIVHCLDLKPRRKPTGTFDIPLITAICRSGLEKIYDMKRQESFSHTILQMHPSAESVSARNI